MISRMKELEAENARLKKLYADVQLQNDVIKAALTKKLYGRRSGGLWPGRLSLDRGLFIRIAPEPL